MGIQLWTIPTGNEITNTTKIKDADNKLQASMLDLTNWVNSTDIYATNGLKQAVDDVIANVESNILSQTSDFNSLVANLNTQWDTTLFGWQNEFNDKKIEWDTELQSIVDDTVVVEW